MLLQGQTINERYELLNLIARGGMGEVWKCNDLILDRLVAIKTVDPRFLAGNPTALSILKDEAKTGAQLIGHPNIVCTLDFGEMLEEDSTIHFIVLEYVKGVSLADWIEEISAKLDKMTNYNMDKLIAWEVCKALGYAHRNKILHRDIKPLNIFLSEYGVSKVGDFGLARFVEAVTRTHTVYRAMSPAYAAPEQWRGEKPNEKTDIYQLGCAIYHLITKRLPFEKPGLPALMYAHLTEEPKPPTEVSDFVAKALSDVIIRALSKEPNKRADLWEIFDAIADEVSGKYRLEVDVHDQPKRIRELVAEITDFPRDDLKKGPSSYKFPDFSEVLSESIEIALLGITNFSVSRIIEKTEEPKAES